MGVGRTIQMAQEVTTAFEATTQRHRAEEAFLQDLADRQRGMLKNVVMFQPGLLFTSNVTYVLSPVDGPGYVPPPAERLPTQATDPAPPSPLPSPRTARGDNLSTALRSGTVHGG